MSDLVLQQPADDDPDGWYRILVDEQCVYVFPSTGCSYSYFVLAHRILRNLGLCDKVITGFLNVMELRVTVPEAPPNTH